MKSQTEILSKQKGKTLSKRGTKNRCSQFNMDQTEWSTTTTKATFYIVSSHSLLQMCHLSNSLIIMLLLPKTDTEWCKDEWMDECEFN